MKSSFKHWPVSTSFYVSSGSFASQICNKEVILICKNDNKE